ncbi:HEAT repeat protein [Necator americanus]|uniref:HEAT repeat protein n=1 Tax=Necator americanus TaxID=51031 RepID=W2SQI9_NECAM|nr:HEAT repeat protein [Necator americanus]ETN70962.1 HEAT repeat protein [Necator americanus]
MYAGNIAENQMIFSAEGNLTDIKTWQLGDSKPQVREAASCVLVDLANVEHSSHEAVLERLWPGFLHKQYLVRIGAMEVFVRLLDESRDELEVQSNRLIPTLCKLMSDPNAEVREVAANTLAHVMLVLGEEISNSIRNRKLVNDNKMQLLVQRYESALRRSSCPSSAARPTRPARRFEPNQRNVSGVFFAFLLISVRDRGRCCFACIIGSGALSLTAEDIVPVGMI